MLPTDLLIFRTPSVPRTVGRLRVDGLRLRERLAVAAVEGADDLAADSSRWAAWSRPTGTRSALVDDDVGGLQDRVREQAVVDVVRLLLLLLLVGRRPLHPADGRYGREQPGELGVLGAVALDEERACVRIEPEGQEGRGHLARSRAEHVGIVEARQRVVVDDAVDRLELALQRDIVANRAQVVAEVRRRRTAGSR